MVDVRNASRQNASPLGLRLPNGLDPAQALLYAGLAVIFIPTLVANARQEWSLEQGQQGPIVLALGLWLLWRRWPAMQAARQDSSPVLATAGLLVSALAYVFGRVSDQILVESYALYLFGVAALYALLGARSLRAGWFPLLYLVFALPAPYTLTFILTHNLRIWVTAAAVFVCQLLGMSVVRDGLNIMVDQYVLAVQEACSGMNSLISLSAIGLLYIYVRRNAAWWYILMMIGPIVFFAIFGNFVRVLILVGLTHSFGDAVAQSYLHETAGLVVFATALLGVIGLDALAAPLLERAGVGGGPALAHGEPA